MDLEERIDQLEKQKEILKTSIKNFKKSRSLNTMDEIAYRELEYKNRVLQKRVKDLEEINKSHQKLNGELREDNRRLAKQVEDQVDRFRKSGGL